MPSRRPIRARAPRALMAALLAIAVLALPAAAQDGAAGPGESALVVVPCPVLTDAVIVERAVAVAAGGSLTLQLCADPAAGFRWSDPAIGEPAVLALGTWTWGPPADGLPGAPGAETITLDALAPGSTTIALDYRRPWEPPAASDPRLLVAVRITDRPEDAAAAMTASTPSLDGVELIAPAGTLVRWNDSTTLARELDQPFAPLEGTGVYALGMWLRLDLVLPDGEEHAFTVTRQGESSRTRAFVNRFADGLWQCAVADTADRCLRPLGAHELRVGIAPDGRSVRIVVE